MKVLKRITEKRQGIRTRLQDALKTLYKALGRIPTQREVITEAGFPMKNGDKTLRDLWGGPPRELFASVGLEGRKAGQAINKNGPKLKTHCLRGHDYAENAVWVNKGRDKRQRDCRKCRNLRQIRYRRRGIN